LRNSFNYNGTHTTSGNSEAMRFDKRLFKQHPEFGGAVRARILSKGVMLVTADSDAELHSPQEHEDSLLVAWLGFIEQDFSSAHDMPDDRLAQMHALTTGVVVDPDEALDIGL
jgi:antitoxin PrlF